MGSHEFQQKDRQRTKTDRPEFDKLIAEIKGGDTEWQELKSENYT